MIVRATPRPYVGHYPRPLTFRERWYMIEARKAGYTTRHMKRYIRGDSDRFFKIVRFLELPPRPRGIHVTAVEYPSEPLRPLLRRCQECCQVFGRETCPCGKE